MQEDYSIKEFQKFLKKLPSMSENSKKFTVRRINECLKVIAFADEDQKKDLSKADLDSIFHEWEKKNDALAKSTLRSMKARFIKTVKDFITWEDNKFEPSSNEIENLRVIVTKLDNQISISAEKLF